MDVLNDNDDNNMDIDNDALDENNSSNNNEEDNIDHNRLRELANFADQNRADDELGRPTYSWHHSDSEKEEIRAGETKMVSYKEPDRYEGSGISLNWGEYYVPDNDDESSISCEEAEEINEEEVNSEDNQAHSHALATLEKELTPSPMNYDQLDNNIDTSNPTLMGMPDIILEKILDYSIWDKEQRAEACTVELVCKRIRRLITNDAFWIRRHSPKFTRIVSLQSMALLQINKKYQRSTSNAILDVLGDGSECVASTFRTISADILSRMAHHGEAHFRLRGDTIGYIAELLQAYMVDRLESAILLAIHRQGSNRHEDDTNHLPRRVVQTDDIALAFRRQTALFTHFLSSCFSSSNQTRCDISAGHHGQVESLLDCSCSLPSSSEIVWRWPLDNCHEVLPAEAGRRIIRRLAYIAGIPEMSNEAFILAEAELLHALGVLLVSAYESCVDIEKTRKTQLLGVEEELTYNQPNVPFNMFKSSPPPFYPKPRIDGIDHFHHNPDVHPDAAVVYTIVPGQIETAAEERGITPRKVYGDVWVAISGFSPEEEKKTEKSYYYKETFHGDVTEESDNDSVDNDWAREYDEDEDSNIDYEMDIHQYYDSREDDYLYYDSDMELDLHYDSANDEMYSHEPYRNKESMVL